MADCWAWPLGGSMRQRPCLPSRRNRMKAPAGSHGLRAQPPGRCVGCPASTPLAAGQLHCRRTVETAACGLRGLGLEQGHEVGLLDGPPRRAVVQGELADAGGLAGSGAHQDYDAADGAAEGSSGHGRTGEEHQPSGPARAAAQGTAPQERACISPCARRAGWGTPGEVIASPWLPP